MIQNQIDQNDKYCVNLTRVQYRCDICFVLDVFLFLLLLLNCAWEYKAPAGRET